MKYYVINFLGSVVAIFIWSILIQTIDISSPNRHDDFDFFGRILLSAFVGLIYFVLEVVIIRRRSKTFWAKVVDSLIISAIGSFGLMFLILLLGILLGYVNSKSIELEIVATLVLGLLLFLLNFATSLICRRISHFLWLRSENKLS